MKIKKISIYKEFQCTGAACRENCCRGWKVPLDAEICAKYQAEKKRLGVLFPLSIQMEEGIPSFRRVFGRCPFWGGDGLCGIQKKYGEAYMPQVCRQFPRRLDNLGFFCEETLYLACPEAARLFLAHAAQGEHFDFEETKGEAAYATGTTNEDQEFLGDLLSARGELIEMLAGGLCFDSMAILQYGRDAQEACLNGRRPPSPLAYQAAQAGRLRVDCVDLNRMFFSGFYHPYLKVYAPFLHQLCLRYIKEIWLPGRVNGRAAERRLDELRADLYRLMPGMEQIIQRYYEYYLQSEFLIVFEDYSFLKCLLYGMAKAHMLWVLMALYADGRGGMTDEDAARIIAVYERRAPQIKRALPAPDWPAADAGRFDRNL